MAASSARILEQVRAIIPPLSAKLHKGQAGRVGVVGGSADYTGAPFFSSMSAMLLGADLAHVICEPTAGNVIKTYSPDLIVHRILDESQPVEKVEPIFKDIASRLHVLVIGPGMGRSDANQAFGRMALRVARQQGMYVVLDADGLWMVQMDPEVVKGYSKAVLTPNVMEFQRLCDKLGISQSEGDPTQLCAKVSLALGRVTVLQKGPEDIISNGVESWTVNEQGSLKRCGGQGDVLSGCVGTFLAWAKNFEEGEYTEKKPDTDSPHVSILAAYGAATITRTASRFAFAYKKRAMQSSDLLDHVGDSYEYHFGEGSSILEEIKKRTGRL
ncbi:Ribokinase-like protein [Dacryopinax primogenitus]|uniref:ATP-dependent (S)-NAD(P)H-hydrate dehydratase n=1 Tax=Dacryopinax primogenitus (strain DJM 731) TaxID=1858805 RepID=M5G0C2_DACPD|nr:Ribokinase-like protein [Dacryopinax primogenitus]EJU03686.1 Ribokinase-like protein [Dacryopinax primogenitus]